MDLAFDYIDTDNSGALDVSEIREKLGKNLLLLKAKISSKKFIKN